MGYANEDLSEAVRAAGRDSWEAVSVGSEVGTSPLLEVMVGRPRREKLRGRLDFLLETPVRMILQEARLTSREDRDRVRQTKDRGQSHRKLRKAVKAAVCT